MTKDFYCDRVLPGNVEVTKIFESDNILAFHHTNPFWEVHIVIIPKMHIDSFTTIPKNQLSVLAELIQTASHLCAEIEASHGGCRLSTNCGNYQSNKHLHFYIHAGAPLRKEDGSLI